MIVAMVGLPATGKTTIAQELAKTLDGVVVSKDTVRNAVFPAPVRDYSPAQDDLCMEMVYMAVGYIVRKWPAKTVIIDGRTYYKREQITRLIEITDALGVTPRFIECVSDDKVIRQRLRISPDSAANRDFDLYRTLRANADPVEVSRLTVDTGILDVPEAVARCLQYLNAK